MPVLNRFDNICLRLVTHCIIDLRVVSYLLSVANLGCARLLTLGEQLGYESLPTPCGRRARDRPSDQAGEHGWVRFNFLNAVRRGYAVEESSAFHQTEG